MEYILKFCNLGTFGLIYFYKSYNLSNRFFLSNTLFIRFLNLMLLQLNYNYSSVEYERKKTLKSKI